MEKKYTKLCKRALVVGMVISIICVFLLGFMVKGWFSFAVVVGGVVLVLAAHSFWRRTRSGGALVLGNDY